LEFLISKNANVNVKNIDGENVLFYAKNIEIMKILFNELIDYDEFDINEQSLYDRTLLMHFTEMKNIKIVQFLLEKNALVNDECEEERTLMIAVLNSNVDMVKLLLQHNADVNVVNLNFQNCLMLSKNIEITKILLEKNVNVNETDEDNKTALFYAVSNGEFEIAKILIEHRADVRLT
jgi:ankyrin repeat protein